MHYPQDNIITPHNDIYKTEQFFTNDMSPADVLGRRVSLGPPHQNIALVKISAPGHIGVEACAEGRKIKPKPWPCAVVPDAP